MSCNSLFQVSLNYNSSNHQKRMCLINTKHNNNTNNNTTTNNKTNTTTNNNNSNNNNNNNPETRKYWIDAQQGIVSTHGERDPYKNTGVETP